jgi:threonine dehydrogenase-like Zn-dependent dehydrogenase
MRAVKMPGGSRIDIVDVARPEPGPDQVLIGMKAAGLCGSDLHMQYLPAPERRRDVFYGLQTDPDIVPGHEAAGVIAAVGESVEHLAIGDRVTVHHMAGCGHCRQCRAGWDINCDDRWGVYGLDRDGALQDSMIARARDCVRVPDNVTLEEACYYSCGAGTGYLALRRGDLGPGDVVAVVGLGPVGIAATYFARLAGAVVIGFDTQDARNDFARDVAGATAVVNPRTEDGHARLMELTDGHGADVVVEATGISAARELAFSIAALHGRIVCVGFTDEVTPLHLQRDVLQKQVDVRGSWMFPIHALDDLLQSVSRENVSIERLITARFGLSDADTAWARFAAGSLGKTVITWEGA